MKLVKLVVSLACCLLFSTPLWAASNTPIDEATPNPSGLYALSHISASGAVTELTDKELAKIEGGLEAVMVIDYGAVITCPIAICANVTLVAPTTHGEGQTSEKPLPSTAGIKSNAAALTNTRTVVTLLFSNL
jgi:bacteriocin-like protein